MHHRYHLCLVCKKNYAGFHWDNDHYPSVFFNNAKNLKY
jgi:hypothetical protein